MKAVKEMHTLLGLFAICFILYALCKRMLYVFISTAFTMAGIQWLCYYRNHGQTMFDCLKPLFKRSIVDTLWYSRVCTVDIDLEYSIKNELIN